ncbi:MAG: slipin family protein [Clostridia bacterium]|nr:slipin family protein [Clostridia bacterium]
MKTVTIQENEMGLLFKNGRYQKLLTPGKYYLTRACEVEIVSTEEELCGKRCALAALLADKRIRERTSVVEVAPSELALHYVNGRFKDVLANGRHAFWSVSDKHEYQLVSTLSPEIDPEIPEEILCAIPSAYLWKVTVEEYQKARLYFNKRFVRLLDAGIYYFWNGATEVKTVIMDTRVTGLNITGQELLTQDKVSLRISVVLDYRITDFVRFGTEVANGTERLHLAAQLALREFVGLRKLDEILESKTELARFLHERLKAEEPRCFVEILMADVKDIILPGEIRQIMNTVLVAEKRAQANVITRREEVASTRSLLNTAKLMDENRTLYKLKELEYIERICENVGNITLSPGGDLLTQLMGLLGRDASEKTV